MNTSNLTNALERARSASGVSGLALAVAYGQGPANTWVTGEDAQGRPLTEDSLFPLASVTKLATALCILRLCDRGLADLDDPLGKYIPNAASAQPGITLRRLLTHSAGLPDFDEESWTWDEHLTWPVMAADALRYSPVIPPGSKVAYRNLDYALLGLVIEQVTGTPLKQAMPEWVFRPLRIEAYQGIEPPRQPAFIRDPGDKHADTPLALWNTAFWRSWGEPWGGIITTPAGTVGLLRAYLGYPEGFLNPATATAAVQDQAGGLGGGFDWQEFPSCPWGLGPMIFLEGMQHWLYPNAPAGIIGHGGYSGCVVFSHRERAIHWAIHGTCTAAEPWWQTAFSILNAAVLA
jgi:CubicO group peptidase (beta-lactamase class C family)